MNTFRNRIVSVSRLITYEECPRRFFFRYVAKTEPTDEDVVHLKFGRVLHVTLDTMYTWVKVHAHKGLIPERIVTPSLQQAFTSAQLADFGLFREGLKLLRKYAAETLVDHEDLVGIEYRFELDIGEFRFVGAIDRVDAIDKNRKLLRIIDYKSNFFQFTQEELDNDIQMSIYGIVGIKQLGAESIDFQFHMLKHGTYQRVQRTREQMTVAARYLVSLARQTEAPDQKWDAKVNANCRFCEYRSQCDAYQNKMRKPGVDGDLYAMSIEQLVKTWQDLSVQSKLLFERRNEAQEEIRKHIRPGQTLKVNGFEFYEVPQFDATYSVDRVIDTINRVVGWERARVRRELEGIADEPVKKLLEMVKEEVDFKTFKKLELELDVIAQKKAKKPKFSYRSPPKRKLKKK